MSKLATIGTIEAAGEEHARGMHGYICRQCAHEVGFDGCVR